MEYKVGQPIAWAEFKKYPKEMKQEWVNTFAEKFECSTKGMAIVFGLHNTSINSYLQKHEISIPKTGVYNEKKGDAIRAWIAEATPTPPAPEPTPEKPKKTEPKKPEIPYFVNTIQHGTMQLTGSATEIFQTLFGIFRDARLQLDIEFSVIPAAPTVAEPEPEPEPVAVKLDLNKCTFRELRAIGAYANTAANIIQHRPYKSVEDLKDTPGVPPAVYFELLEKVTVNDAE